MEALLAIGGEAPGPGVLGARLAAFPCIAAADSGLDLLKSWNLSPDLIVGDMDSLADPALLGDYPEAEIHRLPRAKDESDTEAGLRLLREKGATRVVLVGGGAGRLDHLLAIRALFERPFRPAEWYTAREDIFLVESGGRVALATVPGQTLSVFPLGAGSRSMSSRGLAWPLDGLAWGPGDYGLSNEALGDEVSVAAGEGDLLLIRLRGPGSPTRPSRG